jgi:anti-anti-sigma factor
MTLNALVGVCGSSTSSRAYAGSGATMNGLEIGTEFLNDGTGLVSVAGDVDMSTASHLETALLAAVESAKHGVIVDLSTCEFIDSSGIAALLKANRCLDGAGPLALIVANPDILRVFEVTGVDRLLKIHSTIEAARDEAAA